MPSVHPNLGPHRKRSWMSRTINSWGALSLAAVEGREDDPAVVSNVRPSILEYPIRPFNYFACFRRKGWRPRRLFVRNLFLLVLWGLGKVSVDRLFAQRLACFEPMQTFYEDEAITIRPNQDRHLLSDFQHTLGDLLNNLWFERFAAFYRHVNVRDRELFSPHHYTSPKECQQYATNGNNLSLADVLLLPEILEPIGRAPSAPDSSDWQASGQAPGLSAKGQQYVSTNQPNVRFTPKSGA
jgi:hypothetical protein